MLKNTNSSYGLITKLFHWIISIAIITMLIVGFTMTSMSPSPDKWKLYNLHKAAGIIVLSLIVLRFLWRIINVHVNLPDDLPNWQKLAASTSHYVLYIFMFLMPVTGILLSRFAGHDINVFDLFIIPAFEKNDYLATLFDKIHVIGAFCFVGLISLHFCAAMYHHFIRKDNILIRMIK